MSPIGIQRTVAIILILSPWIFIPGVFKEVVFIVAGILLLVSTLDLRKKIIYTPPSPENENMPRAASREAAERSGEAHAISMNTPVIPVIDRRVS
jgi:hypothetical protein